MANQDAPAAVPFKSSDLIHLQCPFQSDDQSGAACPRKECPFGHRPVSGEAGGKASTPPLRLISSNFCMDHLLGACTANYKSDKDDLRWCKKGFHPRDLAELERIDWDLYNREYSLPSTESGKKKEEASQKTTKDGPAVNRDVDSTGTPGELNQLNLFQYKESFSITAW